MHSSLTKELVYFATIARQGSFSAAAEVLGVSQPTLSRALQRLEEELAGALVRREGRGIAVTPLGAELLPLAEEVEAAQERFWLRAKGRNDAVQGLARISTSEVIGVELLPDWVRGFQERYPQVTLALVATNAATDLARGEADIAVRLFRPRHDALITRKIGELGMHLYGDEALVAEIVAGDRAPRFVGFDRDRFYLTKVAEAFSGQPLPPFHFRTDAQLAQLSAVRAGVGVGAVLDAVAARYPNLARFPLSPALPPLPVWLTTHQELRRNQLLRVVYDDLASFLSQLVS